MKKYLLYGFLLQMIACKNNPDPESKNSLSLTDGQIVLSKSQQSNAGIQTGKLEQMNVAARLIVNGKIDVPPQNMVSVSIPLGGYLKSTQLLPGMPVHKGDVIAVVEDQQYIQLQQDYLMAKAKVSFSENEYRRQKELNLSKASSDKNLQQTEAENTENKILVKSLFEKLKLIGMSPEDLTENTISRSLTIKSPIDGYVSKVNVNIGKYVNPSDVLFELINPSDIHLALKVYEKDLDKLFVGQTLLAYTNHNPTKKYKCEILLVSKDLSAERSADVHCHFIDYDKNLLPGMYMNAEIELHQNKANVLPDDAIVRYENKQYAFVVKEENTFKMVEISTGNSENGFTSIQCNESAANQLFVKKGAYSLLMALKNKSAE